MRSPRRRRGGTGQPPAPVSRGRAPASRPRFPPPVTLSGTWGGEGSWEPAWGGGAGGLGGVREGAWGAGWAWGRWGRGGGEGQRGEGEPLSRGHSHRVGGVGRGVPVCLAVREGAGGAAPAKNPKDPVSLRAELRG